MDKFDRIITEAINKNVLDNQINKIEKSLANLNTLNLSSYGDDITNFCDKVSNLGWYIVNNYKNSNNVLNNILKPKGNKGFSPRFNPYGFSNTLRRYGFKIPDEGITNNVYRNTVSTYNWMQDKIGIAKDSQQQNNAKQAPEVGKVQKLMARNWPQLFTEYANLLSRKRAELSRIPILVNLVQQLEQLYESLRNGK